MIVFRVISPAVLLLIKSVDESTL